MGATLDALRSLQDIEHQIRDIKRQLRSKERVVTGHEKKLKTLQAEITAERAEIQRLQVAFQALDTDVKARTGNIQKHREQLNSVRTNKEYAAILAQLNNDKADLTRVEHTALEQMQAIEQRQEGLKQKLAALEAEEARRDEVRAEAQQASASYSGKLGELEKERTAAAGSLSPEAMQLFERLSERFDGDVLAPCERTHPRKDEFVCGGCFLSLTIEVANALLSRDEIVTCKNCGRILTMERGT